MIRLKGFGTKNNIGLFKLLKLTVVYCRNCKNVHVFAKIYYVKNPLKEK